MEALRNPAPIRFGAIGATTTVIGYVPVRDASILTDVSIVASNAALPADAANKITVTVTDKATGNILAKITNDAGVSDSAATDAVNIVKTVTDGNSASPAAGVEWRLPLGRGNANVVALGYGYKNVAGAYVAADTTLEVKVVTAGTATLADATVICYLRQGSN